METWKKKEVQFAEALQKNLISDTHIIPTKLEREVINKSVTIYFSPYVETIECEICNLILVKNPFYMHT